MSKFLVATLLGLALIATIAIVNFGTSNLQRRGMREGGSGTFRHAVMQSRANTCQGLSPLKDKFCQACLYNAYHNVPGLVYCPGLPSACTESGKDVKVRNYKLSMCLGCILGDDKVCRGEVQTKTGIVHKELVDFFVDSQTKEAIDIIVYGFPTGDKKN